MQRTLKIAVTLAAVTAASAIGAFAAHPELNDALLASHSRISLVQAVRTAEDQLQGQAVRAELETSHQGWIYNVEVVAKGKPCDVAIDAVTGSVLTTVTNPTDNNDGSDARN